MLHLDYKYAVFCAFITFFIMGVDLLKQASYFLLVCIYL